MGRGSSKLSGGGAGGGNVAPAKITSDEQLKDELQAIKKQYDDSWDANDAVANALKDSAIGVQFETYNRGLGMYTRFKKVADDKFEVKIASTKAKLDRVGGSLDSLGSTTGQLASALYGNR